MVVLSKKVFEKIAYRNGDPMSCADLHIWEKSCWKASTSPLFLMNIGKGTAAFFLPIYVVKVLLNYQKLTGKQLLRLFLFSELRSICYGLLMGFLLVTSICLFSIVLGRIHYYSTLFLPGFISALSVLIESEENRKLDTLIFFNSFVETIIRKARLTKTFESILFIGMSGILMGLMEKRENLLGSFYLWFYIPPKKGKKPLSDGICEHPLNCTKYIMQGIQKYFAIGYAIGVLKLIIPKLKMFMKSPWLVMKLLITKKSLKFGAFLGSYIGIYRAITCFLTKTSYVKRDLKGFIAGLFSGLSYAIFPNFQILILGITTTFQLLYLYICSKLRIEHKDWYRQLLFMSIHGYLLHTLLFNPDIVSHYYKNMIDVCCSSLVKDLSSQILGQHIR